MAHSFLVSRSGLALAAVALASAAGAGPVIVPTAEGQIGVTPGVDDRILGASFESIRGQPGDVILGGIVVFGGAMPAPPEFGFQTDSLDSANPFSVGSTPNLFDQAFEVIPGSARSRNATNDGDLVAFSYAVDGTQSQTMTVRLATFDENGNSIVDVPVAENVTTTPVPDPTFVYTGVAVDQQGRATVAYSDFGTGQVFAGRFDGNTGTTIDAPFSIGTSRAMPDVALLDPAGERLIIPHTDFNTIRATFVDFSGATPNVGPDVTLSTTVATFGNTRPRVAADPTSGRALVVWENNSAAAGDPINLRGRQIDEMGNAVGSDDFQVNTTVENAQAQPAVTAGPFGGFVSVWAGDSTTLGDELDIFAQAFDAFGNPIGGEIPVNTTTVGVQDRPTARFLPETDSQGRPQFTVAWRDVGNPDGSDPNGTGTSYRTFSLNGFGDPTQIFEDGFESGDTSSWSSTQP